MSRSRLAFVLLSALVGLTPAMRAEASSISFDDLDRLQAIAQQEGMPIKTIRCTGPRRLVIRTEEPIDREAFVKRASLIAYFVFHRMPTEVEAIAFENTLGAMSQACTIKATDHTLYLQDRISKAEYDRRLGYRQTGGEATSANVMAPLPVSAGTATAPTMPALPSMPSLPTVIPVIPSGAAPEAKPAAGASPLKTLIGPTPHLATMLGFAYGLGVGASYDAYQVEYGHPVLPTLDVRPSLQIISPFSPVNFIAGAARPMEGLSLACDMLGTTRQAPNAAGFAFEGGLGARLGLWQGPSVSGLWPAMHLRVGVRWQALTLGMRYPLLRRDNDPTGGWEANVGFSMPFGGK